MFFSRAFRPGILMACIIVVWRILDTRSQSIEIFGSPSGRINIAIVSVELMQGTLEVLLKVLIT